MSKQKPICVTINYFEDEKYVELPLNYDKFIINICTMLGIQEELIEKFQFSYQNDSDLKIYIIKKPEDYSLFLKSCAEKKTKKLFIKLINVIDEEINNKENEIEIKENNANKNYKESFIEEEKEIKEDEKINQEINNKNENSGNIINIDDDSQSLEFSYLNEKKNINEKNKINDNDKNINKNIHNNLPINYQEKLLISNSNFNVYCNICKKDKKTNIIYYCNDCKIFFCEQCEEDIGKIHKHCYYKIKNQKQYDDVKNKINTFGNKFENLNNNVNKSIINSGNNIENSVKEIFSKGSKIFGNIKTSLTNLLNSNENDNDNQNNNNNELNNPYSIKNNINPQKNVANNSEEDKLKLLVKQAKENYSLPEFSDKDIEKALVENNGNIEDAVSMLLELNN